MGWPICRRRLQKTEKELETLQKLVEDKLSDAASMIFTSHLLILKDKSFLTAMTVPVQKGKNAPDAVIAAGQKYIALFSASPDPLHEREGPRYRRSGNAAHQESRR